MNKYSTIQWFYYLIDNEVLSNEIASIKSFENPYIEIYDEKISIKDVINFKSISLMKKTYLYHKCVFENISHIILN